MDIVDKNDDMLYQRTIYETTEWDDEMLTIAIDFDCTVIESSYPKVGKSLPNCVETLKRWTTDYKVGLILNTMRDGKKLDDAVNWFKENDIPLIGVQSHPTQNQWTTSPKCHANFCLDDRNIGTQLTLDSKGVPCVDWKWLEEHFEPLLKRMSKRNVNKKK